MLDSQTVTIAKPRLLRGEHGWWYLAERRLLLLGPSAVDDSGQLRPEIDERLRAAGVNDPGPPPPYSLTVLTATACNLGTGRLVSTNSAASTPRCRA